MGLITFYTKELQSVFRDLKSMQCLLGKFGKSEHDLDDHNTEKTGSK